MLYSVFVSKKPTFDAPSQSKLGSLKNIIKLSDDINLKMVNHYLIKSQNEIDIKKISENILSENNVDDVVIGERQFTEFDFVLPVRPLPGQFDLRAQSAKECIGILTEDIAVSVKTSIVYGFNGNLSSEDKSKIEKMLVNSLENEKISLDRLYVFEENDADVAELMVLDELMQLDETQLAGYIDKMGLAMGEKDLAMIIDYFASENRVPTEVELRVLDTYWSDHCRHTTFNTKIKDIEIAYAEKDEKLGVDVESNKALADSLNSYANLREEMGVAEKELTLMELATLYTKHLYKTGKMPDLDVSEEINACSINVPVTMKDGRVEDMLLMFKNETHNHPTEIEPYGGAATCLGGAIRDPLSGRAYVYGAMRVTGAENPKADFKDTIEGKLPQYKITRDSARGYSSYGNQMGLATGLVKEFYHKGFLAKRMEIGAVIASAKKENVIRETPQPSDVVILVGGRTGRDGVGGATGSSKSHDKTSLVKCSSEVQKGNPPTERKIIRLFMNEKCAKMIKRCNDFGAGGVAVAVGEIADSLEINLDKVLKKYDGLSAVELAISESQERMAVVVTKENQEEFIKLAKQENLEAVVIAEVTDSKRLRMSFKGQTVFDISRDFIESSGASREQDIVVNDSSELTNYFETANPKYLDALKSELADIKNASQKGLIEMFDCSIGARSVTAPLGGKNQITESDVMIHHIPVGEENSKTMSLMTFFYDPELAELSPFYGAYYSVLGSIARVVAAGFDYKNVRLTFQEYFEKLGTNNEKWGKPFSALLGAYAVQKEFEVSAIGGKDSMSGSFGDINVPPTLVSFAVSTSNDKPIANVLKKEKSSLYMIDIERASEGYLDIAKLRAVYDKILANKESISAMKAVDHKGYIINAMEMAFGNGLGLSFDESALKSQSLKNYGSIILQSASDMSADLPLVKIADVTETPNFDIAGQVYEAADLMDTYKNSLSSVYEISTPCEADVETLSYDKRPAQQSQQKINPVVFIPVFPGTNCEHDTKRVFAKNGATVITEVFKNITVEDIKDSIDRFEKAIEQANIIAIPGGFSAGDEPEGSAKFIASVFRNEKIKKAVNKHLSEKDGLIIGICNGFQALIKLGLFEHDYISDLNQDSPTLTYNKIGRHVSKAVKTRVSSVNSAWLTGLNVGDINSVYVSNGEGRVMMNKATYQKLRDNGQIFSQYVDDNDVATMNGEDNPSGSMYAIEGLISKNGRVLGKMGHTERTDCGLYINYQAKFDETLFEAGVKYFKGE